MATTYRVNDRIISPDNREGKLKSFSGTTKVIMQFDDGTTKTYQIAAIRKATT